MSRPGRRALACLVVAGALVAGCGTEDDGALVVFAASSLGPVIERLGERFAAAEPTVDRVEVDTGGSDALVRLIGDGAPADVLVSADLDSLARLDDPSADPMVVARNRATIVVPADNPAGIVAPTDVARPGVTLALCEPAVPCGAAALELFALLGIDPSPDTLEPNVRAALTKVELGEVDAAVVYRTDALSSPTAGEIPVADAPRRPVAAVPVSERDAAGAFVAFLQTPEATAVFAEHGFEPA